MKKFGLFFLSMIFSFGLMAQNVIIGTVKLKGDEQPLAGVTVTLGSTNQQVFTMKTVRLNCRRQTLVQMY